jgi:hypothetical protein
MAGTVKLPLVGETNKATLVIAGVAGVTALGWALWQKKKDDATAATTATATTATTTGTGYGYAAQTYQPYGYGFGSSGLGEYGYGESSGDYGYGYYGAGTPVDEEVPGQAANNAEWSEAAVSALTADGSWTSSDVLTALGLYITGSQLSATQTSIIQAAIAAEGYPPSPGANGYPPAIHTSPATGQTTAIKVANVVGQPQEAAYAILSAQGLKPAGSATIKGKILYVKSQSPAAGASVAKGSTVTLKSTTTAPK